MINKNSVQQFKPPPPPPPQTNKLHISFHHKILPFPLIKLTMRKKKTKLQSPKIFGHKVVNTELKIEFTIIVCIKLSFSV